jgi:hypothetical protein
MILSPGEKIHPVLFIRVKNLLDKPSKRGKHIEAG